MALDKVHLRKLLKIFYLDEGRRVSALRADIREELARDSGEFGGGGDFYAPFWFDAKNHVFERRDLAAAVAERISANPARARLYPLLQNGFLLWWNERRRWSNKPFRQSDWIKSQLELPELDASVKVDNVLSVRNSLESDFFIYPYFSPDPVLRDEAGRLGLWAIGTALPSLHIGDVRILDVIRGETFSVDKYELRGDEKKIFLDRYQSLLVQRAQLKREYE